MAHSDTSPEAAEILRERLRRMTPSQRIEEGARLCKFARHVMRAGIRSRHPDYSGDEVEMALARLLWGMISIASSAHASALVEWT